ncbi:lipopolysaccharide biosynthesis protein [Thioclava atlantica]|uniref:Polysaccharide biosynthesis protein n=1 Tax=Thioclava atlantica TaxID=1317124 RepID=A0A085TXY0_9RHOB|nr:lipopolysaccharide biosynthesis protein [Thioclava atlantica]KFE35577.1 polysaccharide biosynthesis protein [Thioclava atlantica]
MTGSVGRWPQWAMNSLRADLRWSVIGQAGFLCAQAGVIVALAHLAPLSDVGRYGIAVSSSAIVYLAASFGLRLGLATDPAGLRRTGIYLALRGVTTLTALTLLLTAAAVTAVYDTRLGLMLAMVALVRGGESVSDLFYGVFQKAGRVDCLAWSLLLRGAGGLAGFGVTLVLSGSVPLALAAQGMVWWAVALGHDARRAAQFVSLRPEFGPGYLRGLARENVTLGLANLLSEVGTSAPRLIVGALLSLPLAGIYTAVGYVLVLGTAFAAALGHAMTMRLAWAWQMGRASCFVQLTTRFVGVLALLGLVGVSLAVLLGGPLLRLVLGQGYAGHELLLVLMCVVLALRLPVAGLQTALIAQRRFAVHAWLRFWVAIGVIAGCALGALTGGLEGVALALIVVSLIQLPVLSHIVLGSRPDART